MKKSTREWVRKAEADFRAARKLHRDDEPLHDQACFFFQPSAEKYLKALIEDLELTIPRTHLLKNLLAILLPYHSTLKGLRRSLVFLTRFAVETRYPGDTTTKRQAEAAERSAIKVRHACRALLGMRVV